MQSKRTRNKTKLWVLGALCLTLAFPTSSGAVTIFLGPPTLTTSDFTSDCNALTPDFCTAKTFVPTALPEPGTTLVTPTDGTVTSWRVKGAPPSKLRLRIVKAAGNGQFTGVATSGIAKVSDGVSDNVAAIGILAGSQIGVNVENVALNSSPTTLGNLNAPGAAWSAWFPGLADNATSTPSSTGAGSEPLVNATVVLQKPLLFNLTSTEGPETGGDIVVLNGFHLAVATGVTFGGAPAQILAAGNNQVTVRAPTHAPGTVNVAASTAGGTSDESAVTRYTYVPVVPPPPDTKAPALTSFSISPASFKAKTGATVSFKSSEAATVKFSALKKPADNHGRFKAVPGSFTENAVAGKNKFHFDPRFNGKRLKPGRYRLVAVATDAAGNSAKGVKRIFKITLVRTTSESLIQF